MLNTLLSSLKDKGVDKVIVTSKYLNNYTNNLTDIERYYIEDVRSAVFNAYGMAKVSHKPTVVVVDDAYLPSTYTALTEAWFQRVNIIVLAVNCEDIESSSYLNRCVDGTFLVEEETNIESLVDNIFVHHGPILLKIKERNPDEEPIDYTSIIGLLNSIFDHPNILCYNSMNTNNELQNIKPKYKYGIISKYVGLLLGGHNSILCIPEDILALDSNIFNFRNLPNNFRLVVKYTDGIYWDKLQGWINKNNIRTFIFNNNSDKITGLDINAGFAVLVK